MVIKRYDGHKHRGDEPDARHLAQQTGGRIPGNDVKKLTTADIDQMAVDQTESIGMKSNLAVIKVLQPQIDGIEKVQAAHCHSSPGYRLLNCVAGIGPILATAILLKMGRRIAFATSKVGL
ncbi:hypothetical protein [Undibacterium terreum]|uniref:Transposase n=1 Tax=Undibacterium terreum TaxID=1224302 RepID=A0A916XMI7_9BURK|nr:hypothetical protein [Undibacterium terreum]GGC87050.1 hypothetical protein GCM10011396_37940 [Undibacterium terreum]